MNTLIFSTLLFSATSLIAQNAGPIKMEAWITNPDRSALFEKQSEPVTFGTNGNQRGTTIVIDDSQELQSIDGFGFAVTGGSAELMMKMTPAARTKLIHELFATDERNIGVSYIRLSIGASDLNSFVFSYDDLPDGETDLPLAKFNLSQD